jgi:Sec-independent protein translocase protein TatA
MLSLNPEKLFVVLIVAMVLLGPDKLPKLARQVGAGWAKVKAFQQRIESEVRETMPDLPSSQEIARMARSPVAYLNSMAASGGDRLVPDPADPADPAAPAGDVGAANGAWPVDPAAPHDASSSNGHRASDPTLVRPVGIPGHQVPADPGMN